MKSGDMHQKTCTQAFKITYYLYEVTPLHKYLVTEVRLICKDDLHLEIRI